MNTLSYIIIFSLIGGILSLIGGILLIYFDKSVRKIIISFVSFAAGVLLAASFFDILPEAIELSQDSEKILQISLIGFITFFILEKFLIGLHPHHNDDSIHDHKEHISKVPVLLMIGDSLHNFLDGLIIGATFITDIRLGIVTSLAIIAHELPQEIGDFSVLMHAGWNKNKIILINVFSSLLTIIGGVAIYLYADSVAKFTPHLLAFTGGVFIYIAASDLIPEVAHHQKRSQLKIITFSFLGAILLMYFLIESLH